MALVRQANITAWHSVTGSSADYIAREAYEDAVKYFEEELTRDDRKRDWIRAQTSLEDVLETVKKAQALYTATHNDTKARRYVVALASRVQYYGGVLDALAQHHPEYVALVWGAMKFIFTGVLNHAELVTELSKALVGIADILPHIKLAIDLYPIIYLKAAVSRLYAHIMLFLKKAAKWYSMSPARRAFSALAKPYSISYKDTVEQIQQCFRLVDLVASAAARVESRDQTIILQDHADVLKEVMAKLYEHDQHHEEMRQKLEQFANNSEKRFTQVLQVAESTHKVTEATLLEANDHGSRLRDIQFAEILQTLKPERTPDDVLYACQSVAQRRQLWKQPTQDSTKFIQTFGEWVNGPASSLFILQAGLRAEARTKDLAIQAATLLKKSQHTVFWYLSERHATDISLTFVNVLQVLVFQILTQYPEIARSEPHIVNVTAFKAQHSESEWLDLLSLVLTHISKCFLIVEICDLVERTRDHRGLTLQLLRIFEQLLGGLQGKGSVTKVLFVLYGMTTSAEARVAEGVSYFHISVRSPVISASRASRFGRAKKLRNQE